MHQRCTNYANQIFSRSADTWLRAGLLSFIALFAGTLTVAWAVARSDYFLETNRTPPQPVPFSHQHHVSGLGIDAYVDGMVTPIALAVAQHEFARAAAHLALHRRRAAGDGDAQVYRFPVHDVRERH